MKYFFGNTKQFVIHYDEFQILEKEYEKISLQYPETKLALITPIPFIKKSHEHFNKGVQNFNVIGRGAFTGTQSLSLAMSMNNKYVLIGHSEVRLRGEVLETRIKKLKHVLSIGMTPVYCFGETIEKTSGALAWQEIETEMREIAKIFRDYKNVEIFLAYEPVWAIGSKDNRNPEPEYLKSIVKALRACFSDLNVNIVYGGSVNPGSKVLLGEVGIDGVLCGRLSVQPDKIRELLG